MKKTNRLAGNYGDSKRTSAQSKQAPRRCETTARRHRKSVNGRAAPAAAELGEVVCTLSDVTLFQKGSGTDAQYTICDDLGGGRRKASRAEVGHWVIERTIGQTWAAEDFAADLPGLPCHRLAQPTSAERAELATFTANLGTFTASCVYESGNVEHLFIAGPHCFIVVEALSLHDRADGRLRTVEEFLEHHALTLGELVQRRREIQWQRDIAFEPIDDEALAQWATRSGVASQLPAWLRIRLWGAEEAAGESLGRPEARWREGDGEHCLYSCGGSFTETVGAAALRRIDYAAARTLVHRHVVVPALREAIPPSFTGDFGLDPTAAPGVAAAGDVVR